jgi:hypothetical protein
VQIRLRIRSVLRIQRQVVVDDHVDLRDVDSASDDVGRDKDFGLAVSEGSHDGVAFVRFELAMEGGDLVAFGGHATRDFVGGVAALWKRKRDVSPKTRRGREREGKEGRKRTFTKMMDWPIVRRL